MNYYVNKNAQSTGEHEVHKDNDTCPTPPDILNRKPLGFHTSCDSALDEARKHYPNVDGCKHCNSACHSR